MVPPDSSLFHPVILFPNNLEHWIHQRQERRSDRLAKESGKARSKYFKQTLEKS